MIDVMQERIDAALAELASLNVKNEVVTKEILQAFTESDISSSGFSFSNVVRLLDLLMENPISYNESEILQKRVLKILRFIGIAARISWEEYRMYDESEKTNLMMTMISVWDKISAPTFNGRVVSMEQLFWLRDGEFLWASSPLVLDRIVRMLNTRLPTTDEEWSTFSIINGDAYHYLRAISSSIWNNLAYRNYYIETKVREGFGDNAIISTEWGEELFGRPLVIPELL